MSRDNREKSENELRTEVEEKYGSDFSDSQWTRAYAKTSHPKTADAIWFHIQEEKAKDKNIQEEKAKDKDIQKEKAKDIKNRKNSGMEM